MSEHGIESISKESRTFQPHTGFAEHARIGSHAKYLEMYRESVEHPEQFWAQQAKSLHWFKPPTKVLSGTLPDVKWFEDGELNASYNCLDRHVAEGRGDKIALSFEGEPGERRTLTYRELLRETCKLANVLTRLDVQKGDRVAIYMGMVPEAAIAMLACARIGAVHSVVFGGFAAEAIRDRVNDQQAKLVITQDGGHRRGQLVPLKDNVDRALEHCPSVKSVLVFKRYGNPITMQAGRDLWWESELLSASDQHQAVAQNAEDPLFILYTSGSTGKPKGVLHTTGGYMLGVSLTSRYVFDLREDDLYWCTADIGWITGHSYVVYGPLSCGATVLMYEGAPNFPALDRFWDIIERHKVTIFYTAPTAIRSFIRWGDEHVKKHDLTSLRLLGSVGEPINPEAWIWYRKTIGDERCPIVDTWWQTETGAIMVAPLPGATVTKPGSCTRPLPGIALQVVHKDGTPCRANEGGYLVVTRPWPSQLRTVWGDPERYRKTYFGDLKQNG
ncbi:MAG TPA: acetate--CoA ligase, partial [Polyangiales bacterium]